jgi:hypothetical protein
LKIKILREVLFKILIHCLQSSYHIDAKFFLPNQSNLLLQAQRDCWFRPTKSIPSGRFSHIPVAILKVNEDKINESAVAQAAPIIPKSGMRIRLSRAFMLTFQVIKILCRPGIPAWIKMKSSGIKAPIPGEMQVTATAGSVFIQDSRLWHSAPMHNFRNQERVTVVNRWCPWWLSVDDYAPGSRYNVVCRPLSHSEYLALPTELQPLMRHLCPDELDVIQPPLLDRAKAAVLRTQWGYRQLEENLENHAQANEHIRFK